MMHFPENPTIHMKTGSYSLHIMEKQIWEPPETVLRDAKNGYSVNKPFRSCNYCGSIHPEDLMRLLLQGATLHGADWKYGWPHKFYVQNIPSGLPVGATIKIGTDSRTENGKTVEIPIMGTVRRFTEGKWYNVHLQELDDEAFAAMAKLIEEKANIRFEKELDGIKYTAPHFNYQAGFHTEKLEPNSDTSFKSFM